MKKAFRKILRLAAVLAALIVFTVAAAVLLFLFDKPLVKNILQTQLGKRAGMTVRAGKLDYSFFPLRLTVEALALGRENDFQRWDLSMTRLEAKGDFWKLLRGMKPAIETIETEGAVIRLEQKAFPEVSLDLEAVVRQAADILGLVKNLSMRKVRLTVSLPSQIVELDNVDISLTPGDERDALAFSIGCSDIDFKDKNGKISLRSGLTSSGTFRLASPLGFDASFTFDRPRISTAGIEGTLSLVKIESTGRFDPAPKEVALSHLKIGVPDLLAVEGTVGGRFGQGFSLEAEGTARCEKLENVVSLLRPRLPVKFRKTRLRGRAILTGKYGLRRAAGEKSDSLDGSLAFEDIELDHVLNGLPLHIRASGKVQATGPSRAPRLLASIRTSFGPVGLDKVKTGKSNIYFVASANKEDLRISGFEWIIESLLFDGAADKRFSSDRVALTGNADLKLGRKRMGLHSLEAWFDATLKNLFFSAAEGKNLSFSNVILKGKAGLDVDRKIAVVNALEVWFPGLAPFYTEGRFKLGKTPEAQGRIETHGLDIPAVRALSAPFIPESLAGWELGGTANLSLEVRRPSVLGGDWGFLGTVSVAQARLNDPSFTIAGEGLDPMLKVEGEYSASKELSFRGSLDIGKGESLWKDVYVSWTKHPLKLTLAGRHRQGSGGMDGLEARFLFPTIGEVNVSGSVEIRPFLSFDLRSDAMLSLGPVYSLHTGAGVSGENRMTLEGTLRTRIHAIKDAENLSVSGKLNLTDASLERPATKTVLLDVDAELPVHYESRRDAPDLLDGPFPEEGFLRVGEFRNRLITLENVTVPLRAGSSAFSIESFTVDLYGGGVELGRTVFRVDPKSPSFQGVGSLALHDLDISRFPIRSPQFKLTGKVQADFPRLVVSPKEIAISGRGEAEVFGGKVVLRDLAISNPFTPGRSFSLNVDLIDLDLKKLTDEVPFGEVTGVVRGEVRNLIISYGQPERFELRIESVPRKGVPQTFSLKAVDNLTVLSSGQKATAGTSQFWTRFIRGFRYQKLGIVSTLRNDTFTLNGTIREGGVEYLVKKPRLFGINVINRMPEKRISFKEMTSRLKRVGQSEK